MKMTKEEFEAYIDKTMEQGLKLWDATSVSLGVVKDGEVVLCKGYGMRDTAKGLPATGDTLYQIGSCSKAFTSALVAIFVDKGLIDWDTPIREYVPDLRFYDDYTTDNCTLRDVLCHRTGVPRHEYSWYGTSFTRAELLHNLRYLEPNKPFRTTYQYNNYGYLVAGYVLETVSGKTYEQLLEEYIFQPLGMTRSNAYLDLIEGDPDHATPYDRLNGRGMTGSVECPFYRTPVEDYSKGIGSPFAPAGSINSCARDMLKWVQLHLQNGRWNDQQLISEASMAELHKPNILSGSQGIPGKESLPEFVSYAMAWQVENYRGYKVLSHGGNINGFSAFTCFVPELQLGVVAYTNLTMTLQHNAIGRTVLDCFMDAEPTDWMQRHYDFAVEHLASAEDFYAKLRGPQVAGTAPTYDLKAYEGTFARPGYGKLRITAQDGKLHLHFLGSDVPLTHYHYDCFVTDIVFAGGELDKGLPVKFFPGDVSATPEVVSIPLVMEEGRFIRFVRESD